MSSGGPGVSVAGAPPPLTIHAAHIARAHTVLAYAAFGVALAIGSALHYVKIVKNGVAGYPQEWFPSVSATIGDWYPERNLFQILIALTSGPRLLLVALQYYLHRQSAPGLARSVFVFGIIRTLSCGGWVYITSTDDHDAHDVLMITYIVCNLPWFLGTISCTTAEHSKIKRRRILIATAFFTSVIPLLYFFVQHKVHRIPGAYTHYSFFEWGLILLDVLFDSVTESEFRAVDLQFTLGRSLTQASSSEINAATVTSEKTAPSESPILSQETSEKTPAQNGVLKGTQASSTLLQALTQIREPISFLSDLYLSYVFWSIFTSLIPTLFYFSVWELGIAGHELALLSVLSPVLLSISPLRSWAQTKGGLTTLPLLSLSGLGAYALGRPLHRLFAVAFASIIAMIPQTILWARGDQGYQSILAGLGLLLTSLAKHANHSNNPIWPQVHEKSGGYNKTGLVLALVCLTESYFRPASTSASANASKTDAAQSTSAPQISLFSAAAPLGSLIYMLHTYVSDSSTLIAWSWTGYENGQPRGPLPHVYGSLTLIAQSLGILFALTAPEGLINHHAWFVYGAASAAVTYFYKDWIGYAGGLNLALFTMSVIPHVFRNASAAGVIAKTYFTAMLVYCLLALASVWTVAYAFVPGGIYLRERTDLVMIAHMTCLSLAFLPKFRLQIKALPALQLPASVRSYTRVVLAVISTLSVLVTLYRLPVTAPQPWRPGPRIFRAGIWTLHFGIDNEGRDSQRRVMRVVNDMELDVVGFLETDLHRPVYGNRDLTRVMAEKMNYHVDLGPGPTQHTWGAVLLSKFPIIDSTHHLLPSPHGELAPAISAVLDVFGTYVTVVVSHNGQEETPLDRELQSKELARIMSESPYPVVFLGYVVTKPHANRPNPYRILVEDGNMHDIDQDDRDRWCQYILYRGLYRTAYARISRSTITDTELQVGQFQLPKHGYNVTDDRVPARYLRIHKESLPEAHWFPMAYYGNKRQGGVAGHFYHVFMTPLYYNLPEDAVV